MAELQEQLANTPAEVVVANHAFGLFELAALHLSLQPPNLEEARTAIDALGALVEGMTGRLGDNEPELVQGLAQLRLAFVQIRAAVDAAAAPRRTARPIIRPRGWPGRTGTSHRDPTPSGPARGGAGWSP